MGSIATPIMGITKAASASTNFFTMIDAPLPDSGGLKEPDASPHDDITLENVKFSYPSRPNVQILDELNLRFPSGKITAIVGPSGCGKSTIVGLLERWYQINDPVVGNVQVTASEPANQDTENEKSEKPEDDPNATATPNSGSIRVGTHDVQELDLKWWRTQIGLVQQEPFSFHDTIFKNVSFGLVGSKWENENEETKRALVKEACKEAFADEFIDRLPEVCLQPSPGCSRFRTLLIPLI
jgi:ATP-binding cassette subfamily B (MDR/TAP) protein 1